MIERDFILRQVHQLARALARVLSLGAAARATVGEELLSQAVQDITGVDLHGLREASRAELLILSSRDGVLSSDLAVALADILMEDARFHDTLGNKGTAATSRKKSLWLYGWARDAGAPVPIEVLQRLAG